MENADMRLVDNEIPDLGRFQKECISLGSVGRTVQRYLPKYGSRWIPERHCLTCAHTYLSHHHLGFCESPSNASLYWLSSQRMITPLQVGRQSSHPRAPLADLVQGSNPMIAHSGNVSLNCEKGTRIHLPVVSRGTDGSRCIVEQYQQPDSQASISVRSWSSPPARPASSSNAASCIGKRRSYAHRGWGPILLRVPVQMDIP